MAAHVPARSGRQEVHHAVPRCLLRLRDWADAYQEFDGEGIQLWLDYELEALRNGVDPDVSREKLAALVEGSIVVVPREHHRAGHESVISCGGAIGAGSQRSGATAPPGLRCWRGGAGSA